MRRPPFAPGKIKFSDNSLNVFGSYFENRQQCVQINETLSQFRTITKGIPQGSNLGPLLFNLFINDVKNLKLFGELVLFADDIALINSSKDLSELSSNMQDDFTCLGKWFNDNLLKINIEKTNYILFEKKTSTIAADYDINLRINQNKIVRVLSTKYLGLTIDSKLTFHQHIDNLKKKLNSISFAIRRARPFITEETSLKMYFAFFYSKMLYLNPIWSHVTLKKQHELEVMQNRIIKCVKKLPWL